MSNLHNELRAASQHGLALRRMFGGDRDLNVERLSETLQPVVNPYEHAYCSFLRGERVWSLSTTFPAVVGEFTYAVIANPKESGLLVTVEEAAVEADSVISIDVKTVYDWTASSLRATLTLVGGVGIPIDLRWPAGEQAEIWSGSDGSGNLMTTVTYRSDRLITAVNNEFYATRAVPVILKPDSALGFVASAANNAFNLFLRVVERSALVGELA